MWERWNPARAKSQVMRTDTLEERLSYRVKTWGEAWLHRMDDPEIRAHRARVIAQDRGADPAEFSGLIFTARRLRREPISCDFSQAERRLLSSLQSTVRHLRQVFQRPLVAPPSDVTVSVVPTVPTTKRRAPLPQRPSLKHQLTTRRSSATFSLRCTDV
jgi:hypothetical protein